MTANTNSDPQPQDILDLLVDGASPFSGVFRTLRRMGMVGFGPADVRGLWAEVAGLHGRGLIRLLQLLPNGEFVDLQPGSWEQRCEQYTRWLPEARSSDLSVDEVGVWLKITDAGRSHWRVRSADCLEGSPHWMIDLDATSHTITVHARDLEELEAALSEWLKRFPTMRLVRSSIRDVAVGSYLLRSGLRVEGGFRRTAHYEQEHQRA